MSPLFSGSFKGKWLAVFALPMALTMLAIGFLGAYAVHPASAADALSNASNRQSGNAAPSSPSSTFTFSMVPSTGISACLPKASGKVTIKTGSLNDTMTINVSGLPANTGFDFFVIELPNKPFGVAWYQTDLNTSSSGTGSATVRGIFNKETFSVSLGDTSHTPIVFPPTHQYHLGLWFSDPNVPFKLGCEPGQPSPIVTPFNGEQHAGIQVLNTSNFPDSAGPLSHVP